MLGMITDSDLHANTTIKAARRPLSHVPCVRSRLHPLRVRRHLRRVLAHAVAAVQLDVRDERLICCGYAYRRPCRRRSFRPGQSARVTAALGEGDTLLVARLDRLARSTRDLLEHPRPDRRQGRGLPFPCRRMGRHHDRARAAHAHGVRRAGGVRARPDTRPHHGRPRARQGEGREDGKAAKVRLRTRFKEAIKRRDHGEETLAEIGRSYNVSGWTIARLAA